MLDQSWVDVHMSEKARDSLIINGYYSDWQRFRELLKTRQIEEFDAPTIERVANKLMSITPSFEQYSRITEFGQEKFEVTPDIWSILAQGNIQIELEKCVTLIAFLRKYCSRVLGGYSYFVTNVLSPMVQVRAQIHVFDHQSSDLPVLKDLPHSFEGSVAVCDNFQSFVMLLNESAILVGATDNNGVEIAIRVKLVKHAISRNKSVKWESMVVPAIGPKFRILCQKKCAEHGSALPDKILKSIAAAVDGQKLREVHDLNTGPGGDDPPQMRGTDRAQRRKIDRSLRLHYWLGDRGTIELASVNVHEDYSIPM